jgi:hypothetical protein
MAKDRACFPNQALEAEKRFLLLVGPWLTSSQRAVLVLFRLQASAKDRSCTAIEKDPLHLLLEIERRFRAPFLLLRHLL